MIKSDLIFNEPTEPILNRRKSGVYQQGEIERDWEREIWEARNAVEEALRYLYASQKEFNSEGNWE